MQRSYPPETLEHVWALMQAGYGPKAIRLKLSQDHAIIAPSRTISDWVRRLRKERGEPNRVIEPGTEGEAAENLARAALALLVDQVNGLQQAAKSRSLTGSEVETLRRAATAALDLKRRFGAKAPDQSPRATTTPSKLLSELATGPSS